MGGIKRREHPLVRERQLTGAAHRPRELTIDRTRRLLEYYHGDVSRSFYSAAHFVGIHPSRVFDTMYRFDHDKNTSAEDYKVGEMLCAARALRATELRKRGDGIADRDGGAAGVNWYKFRLETGNPNEHPRKADVEVSGPDRQPLHATSVTELVAIVRATDHVTE